MTAPVPSRAAIAAAEPLDFPDRKPAKQDILIMVKATVDGFPVELSFSGSVDNLLSITRRLREMGAQPTVGTMVPNAAGPLRKSAPVTYADDGTPLCGNANCSRHGQPLEPSQHNGYYCKGKDATTGNQKGYCRTRAE